MAIIEQIILDTIQLGGVLIFLRDQAPADFTRWLQALHSEFGPEVAYVVRQIEDLRSEKFRTRPEDLVFFFDSQIQFLNSMTDDISSFSLDSVLQGQRVLFSAHKTFPHVDFVCPDMDLSRWIQGLTEVKNRINKLRPLREVLSTQESPCLFLDRDDVIVRNIPYNRDPGQVELMPGIVELIQQAHVKGLWVAVVTNQSGIGRGRISLLEYKAVHQRVLSLLAEKNCWLDECVWASFIENEAVIEGRLFAGLRKPRAGMFQLVQGKLRVKMSESYMVGDSATDLIAAHSAGVGKLYLYHSDKFASEEKTLREYQEKHPKMHFQILRNLKDLDL